MIKGKLITLVPASLKDQFDIYFWSTHSDIAHMMGGPPRYQELPLETWEEFKEDFGLDYFTDDNPIAGRSFIILYKGERAGQINYNKIDTDRKMVEMDIWLAGSQYARKGIASDAIKTLVTYLNEQFGIEYFILAPSARNTGAVSCYRKLGFIESTNIPNWFVPDYDDFVFLVKSI